MKIWKSEEEYDLGCSVVALGMFDGVHIGHQALIRRARALADNLDAACVVCTFDRHPLSVLDPEHAPRELTDAGEKLRKFATLGVDGVLMQPFTPAYAATPPEAYLRQLVEKLRVRGIVAGFNYTFGDRGRGDAEMIRAQAKTLGYRAEIVPAVYEGGDTVSSTLIRTLLAQGENERAAALLALQ